MEQQKEKSRCEATGCSRSGISCPDCEQCFCWQHLQSSSCETCHGLFYQKSFYDRLGRLVSIGLSLLLCGFLFLLLPRDTDGVVIQLALLLLIGGSLLLWLGFLARH